MKVSPAYAVLVVLVAMKGKVEIKMNLNLASLYIIH